MDKLNPVIRETPVVPQTAYSPSGWFGYESTQGVFTSAEFAWLQAAGWRPLAIVTEGGRSWYALQRRIIKPENVLNDLVRSYTDAYNEGRQLNDQRYDDLVVLYTSVLSKTEDTYNTIETDDATFAGLAEAIVTAIGTDFDAYSADVDGDLDTWGASLLAEVNARFDAELSKSQQSLIDRGLYSGTMWTTISAGIERERTRALLAVQDQITQRQLELKHKVYSELEAMRSRVLAARERVRTYLSNARDRQVAVRNAAAEALGRLVERREDGYPDLAEVGRLAAALGGGSAASFAP